MVFEGNFLRLKVAVRLFFKKRVLQEREFSYPFFRSISHNNLVVTK